MHSDGMRAREVARVEYSRAEIEHIIVYFNWFGTYAVLIKLSADFINTSQNGSAFSFRKRVIILVAQLLFRFFELSLSVGDKLILSHMVDCSAFSQHHLSQMNFSWRSSADFYYSSHPDLESGLWATGFFSWFNTQAFWMWFCMFMV